jgi:site-specific DNA recombinase
LATRMICEKLAELVQGDSQLVEQIVEACQREVEAAARPDSSVLAQLQAKAEKLARTIDFNRRNPGDTPEELEETERLLKGLRSERASLQAEIAALESAQHRTIVVPTPEEVRQMCGNLGETFLAAADGLAEEDVESVRRIVQLLTGGRIDLYQMGQRRAHQGWLQGRFRARLVAWVVQGKLGVRPTTPDEGVEVVIDFRELPQQVALSEKAKALYDQGVMNAEIARQLGCARSYVTHLLRLWFESRGQTMPDGRSRRATLSKKHLEAPLYQKIADEAKVLADQGLLLQDIAQRLGRDRNTITAALKHWYQSRGLPPMDGRSRRKELEVKASRKSADVTAQQSDDHGAKPSVPAAPQAHDSQPTAA